MGTALVQINSSDVFKMPFLALALKTKYKRIVFYVEDIPNILKDYLQQVLRVKVVTGTKCNNYDYAILIKDIRHDTLKVEYRGSDALVYIPKQKLSIQDIKLLKLRSVDRFMLASSMQGKGQVLPGCQLLDYKVWQAWFKQESNLPWSIIFDSVRRTSMLNFYELVESNRELRDKWRAIINNSDKELLAFDNVDEFLVSMVLLSVYNTLNNKQAKIYLLVPGNNIRAGCLPVWKKGELECLNYSIEPFGFKVSEINETVIKDKNNALKLNTATNLSDIASNNSRVADSGVALPTNVVTQENNTRQDVTNKKHEVYKLPETDLASYNSIKTTGAIQGKQASRFQQSNTDFDNSSTNIPEQNNQQNTINQASAISHRQNPIRNMKTTEQDKPNVKPDTQIKVDDAAKRGSTDLTSNKPNDASATEFDVVAWAESIQKILES